MNVKHLALTQFASVAISKFIEAFHNIDIVKCVHFITQIYEYVIEASQVYLCERAD